MTFKKTQTVARADASVVARSMASAALPAKPDTGLTDARRAVVDAHRVLALAIEHDDRREIPGHRNALRRAEGQLETLERERAVLVKPQPVGGLKIEGWDL